MAVSNVSRVNNLTDRATLYSSREGGDEGVSISVNAGLIEQSTGAECRVSDWEPLVSSLFFFFFFFWSLKDAPLMMGEAGVISLDPMQEEIYSTWFQRYRLLVLPVIRPELKKPFG